MSKGKMPVQKGKVISNPPTISQQTYSERVKQAVEEGHMRKRAQTLDLVEPRRK